MWTHQQARPDQIPTSDPWTDWLILAGRGWGKTRTGAEWLGWEALHAPGTRWAVVAPTFADARDTCVEGVAGLLTVLNRYRAVQRWNRSLGELTLRNGSQVKLFSADEPDRLRGPQHHGAWCDELAAWRYDEAWDQLRFGLRLGDHPRTVITTTPRPRRLLRSLTERDGTRITRGSTFDNAANLSAVALAELRERYEGTRLGKQELHGELLMDVEGALWTEDQIDRDRVTSSPDDIVRRVVAVDPAVTSAGGSENGIITVALATNGHLYVEQDRSLHASPDGWARVAINEWERSNADAIVVEVNQGGEMHKTILHSIHPGVPVKDVRATKGKQLRAEPVAALYEQGKVHHVGHLIDLEQQMCEWVPGGDSPDRLDALVWGVTSLAFGRTVAPVQSFRT